MPNPYDAVTHAVAWLYDALTRPLRTRMRLVWLATALILLALAAARFAAVYY